MSVTARAQYRFGHAYLIAPLAVLALVGVTACSSGSSTSPGAGASGGAGATGSVVVAHAAGVNGEAVESLLKQFTAETGIRATGATLSDTDYGAKVQLVAKTGKSDYDVALGMPTDVFQLTAPSGIYSQLDTSKWDRKDVDAMKAANLLGTNSAISQETAALLVSSSKVTKQPTSWGDFFDVTTFPGNRGLASGGLGVPVNVEYANIASGTTADKLYPLDVEKGIEKIRTLGNKAVLWDNAPKGIQDVVNGDTVMTWAYAPSALTALKNNQPIQVSAPPGTAVATGMGTGFKAGPNGPASAAAFLAWWFKAANQVKYTAATGYGIVVPSKEVLGQLTPDQLKYLPFAGQDAANYHVLNYEYYGAVGAGGQSNLATILTAWNKFRSK